VITRDIRAIAENLRNMIRHGVNPTPRELTRLADQLDGMAETLEETTVFTPNVVEMRRGLRVIK
jgi:hypothetical protein